MLLHVFRKIIVKDTRLFVKLVLSAHLYSALILENEKVSPASMSLKKNRTKIQLLKKRKKRIKTE